MKKKLIVLSLVLSLSLVSTLSFANRGMGPRGPRRGPGPRGMMHKGHGFFKMHFMLLKKAGVSDNKIKKMRNIMFDCKEKNAALMVKEQRLHMDLFDEFRKVEYSESKIRSLASQIREVKQTIAKNRLNAMLKKMGVLSKAERKKVLELRKEFFKKHHFRRGEGFRRGPQHNGGRGRRAEDMPR